MNFVRGLIRELVDKRLWPVAIGLVVALIVVPIMLSRGGGGADVPPPAVAPGDAGGSKVVAIELTGPPSVRSRPGKVHNPFRRALEKKITTTTAAAPTGAGAGAGGGATATKESTTAPSRGTTTPTPVRPARPSAPTYYRTVVRWYEADAGTPFALARLTALGGLAEPGVLYLGVAKSDATYAVFLLGPNATSEGEGGCMDPVGCRIVGLKAGESRLVTIEPSDGSATRQFTLEAVAVKAVATGAAEARTMRAKVHPDGRDVMRELWKDAATAAALAAARYDQTTGLLVKASPAGRVDKTPK
jgi:hypothetical protein